MQEEDSEIEEAPHIPGWQKSDLLLSGEISPKKALARRAEIVEFCQKNLDRIARLSQHFPGWPGHILRKVYPELLREMATCEIVIWQDEYWDAATRGADNALVKTPIESSDYSPQMQFWCWSSPKFNLVADQPLHGLEADFALTGFWVIPLDTLRRVLKNCGFRIPLPADRDRIDYAHGWVFALFLETTERDQVLPGDSDADVFWPRLRLSGDIAPGTDIPSRWCATYCAARRFMAMPFVDTPRFESGVISRAERRRLQRRRAPGHDPSVRTVLLRRVAEDEQSEHEGQPEGTSKQFQVWFLVKSHWRKPSPRMKEPRPVFVRPYPKGDFSKPFKPPTESVVLKVRR